MGHMNATELELGYKGPMKIKHALSACDDGDRLLIHSGVHKLAESLEIDNKSLTFIGLGQNAALKRVECFHPRRYTFGYAHSSFVSLKGSRMNVSFENLAFYGDYAYGIVVSGNKNNISIKNCVFHKFPTSAIPINQDSKLIRLEISDCSFLDTGNAILFMSDESEATVTNCLFKRCGEIDVAHPIEFHWGRACAKLKCIG